VKKDNIASRMLRRGEANDRKRDGGEAACIVGIEYFCQNDLADAMNN